MHVCSCHVSHNPASRSCAGCGLVFIFQADSLHHPHDAKVAQLDMGWWPLDQWGVMLRAEFLGRVYGIPRHSKPARDHLFNAASSYDAVIDKIKQTNTSQEAFLTDEGPAKLLPLIPDMMAIEVEAQEQMAKAMAAMR